MGVRRGVKRRQLKWFRADLPLKPSLAAGRCRVVALQSDDKRGPV
jgi:hypothetical protein